MTINDLKWEPSRMSGGFTASCDLGGGRTATVLHDRFLYTLYVRTRDGRIIYAKPGLDRAGLLSRLNYHALVA